MNFLVFTLTLSAHLACMNAATAGPLACAWLDWRERSGDELAGRVGRELARAALLLFLLGMLLGGVMAGLAWTPEFRQDLLDRLPSRLYWGVWELAFSALLMTLYWIWWRRAGGGNAARLGRSSIALLSATNLMYHFPPLFILAAQRSASEMAGSAPLNDVSFRELIWRGDVFALTVHFWLASLAVAGVLVALIAWRMATHDESLADAARLATWGGRLALAATLLQIPVGLWIVTQLPTLRQNRLLGGDLAATALLATGVLAAFWLLHQLAALAMGEASRKSLLGVALLMLAVIVAMTAALRYSQFEGSEPPSRQHGLHHAPVDVGTSSARRRSSGTSPTAKKRSRSCGPASSGTKRWWSTLPRRSCCWTWTRGDWEEARRRAGAPRLAESLVRRFCNWPTPSPPTPQKIRPSNSRGESLMGRRRPRP